MNSPTVRHRLVAILAADVAGFTRLMADDDRATVAALDCAREVFRTEIAINQGRVIDMAGDSVLAVFETVTGVLTTALAVQSRLEAQSELIPDERRMRFRIGVHVGDVIEKPDGSIYGDGVNIAARLESLAEPGGIMVSESTHTSLGNKLGVGFEDLGVRSIDNIPYPVRTYRLGPKNEINDATKGIPLRRESDLSLSQRPAVSVLAFTNSTGQSHCEHFADGISEDIIVELSRFKTLFVIARNSSFSYKGKSVDVRVIGRELGVRYVVDGNVQCAENRVRVTAQLSDASTGIQIWAGKYDRMPEDTFAVQEELTRSIVAAIAPEVATAELAKTRQRCPSNWGAYEIALHARALLTESVLTVDIDRRNQAIVDAKKALATDSHSALALCVLARALWQHLYFNTCEDRHSVWVEGLAAANKAIEVDPADSQGYVYKAALLSMTPHQNRLNEALTAIRWAHDLNPNDTSVLCIFGWIEAIAGNPQTGIAHLELALRINPRDPMRYVVQINRAFAYWIANDYPKAIDICLSAMEEFPESPFVYLVLAVSWAALGEFSKAKFAIDKARASAPSLVKSRMDGQIQFGVEADKTRYMAMLRLADSASTSMNCAVF